MDELEVISISGVDCYEKDGTAYLKLENVAKGLGFTRVAASGNKVVRWETVRKYLEELSVPTSWHENSKPTGKDGLPEFIPENVFYRLAMKAKNETAEKFQAKVADEIIPSIRRHGIYATDNVIDNILDNPDFGIRLLKELKKEREEKKEIKEELTKAKRQLAKQKYHVGFSLIVQDMDGAIPMDEFSAALCKKGFQIGRNNLYQFLRKKKILKENNIPYRKYIDAELFKVVLTTKEDSVFSKTLVTGKGQIFIVKKLMDSGLLQNVLSEEEADKN